MPKLGFFEDEAVNHLRPLIDTRPVFDLRAGILLLRQRIELDLGHDADYLLSRPEVAPLASLDGGPRLQTRMPDKGSEPALYVNGRLLSAPKSLLGIWRGLLEGNDEGSGRPRLWRKDGSVVAAWRPDGAPARLENGLAVFEAEDVAEVNEVGMLNRLWDLTSDVPRFVEDDATAMGVRGVSDDAVVSSAAVLTGNHFLAVGQKAVIEPGAVLYAADGPVIVESDAWVMAGAILRGPCHIGKGAQIKMGATVAGSSIGEQCRVGGEVSGSVMYAYANKAHDGYLGNSYVGAWCNLGAGTNTSNLRNDYREVSLFNEHLGEYEETGRQFIGLIMGDHSRAGISTMFNTATVVGSVCNVFGSGYQPRHIPAFSWGGADGLRENRPDSALASVRVMMARRGKKLSNEEEAVLLDLYNRRKAN